MEVGFLIYTAPQNQQLMMAKHNLYATRFVKGQCKDLAMYEVLIENKAFFIILIHPPSSSLQQNTSHYSKPHLRLILDTLRGHFAQLKATL